MDLASGWHYSVARFYWVQADVMTDSDVKRVRDKHGDGDLSVTKSAAGADPEIGSKGLVSTDQPLLKDLAAWSIPKSYGFALLSPAKASVGL